MKIRSEQVQRRYILGDEWIYYKVFCGPRTADNLLVDKIKPLCDELLHEKTIDGWFFIRYTYPEFHIRLRIHIKDIKKLALLIDHLNQIFKFYMDSDLIHKIQTDTYQRELERYGIETIELSEKLFFYDSEMVVDAIQNLMHNADSDQRWLFAVRTLDSALTDFHLSLDQKLRLMERLKDSYAVEFGMKRSLKQQLDQKYRKYSTIISELLSKEFLNNNHSNELNRIVEKKSQKSCAVIKEILHIFQDKNAKDQLNDYIASLLHMLNNRIFRTRHRKHEMVLYDFLFRYYKSETAKLKFKKDV